MLGRRGDDVERTCKSGPDNGGDWNVLTLEEAGSGEMERAYMELLEQRLAQLRETATDFSRKLSAAAVAAQQPKQTVRREDGRTFRGIYWLSYYSMA